MPPEEDIKLVRAVKFTSNSAKSLIEKIKQFIRKPKAVIFTISVFVLLLAAAAILSRILEESKPRPRNRVIDHLAVQYVSPFDKSRSTRPKITIKFNLPVTAHHVDQYVSISPHADGVIEQGSNNEEVVFEPKTDFPRGSVVTVLLKAGLPSDSGKMLNYEYRFSFKIDDDPGMMAFTKGDWAGKFMSFQADLGTDLTLKVGPDLSNPSVRIFKANLPDLLSSLTYKEYQTYYYGGSGAYEEKEIDTKKLKLVEEIKDVKDKQNINFKNEKGLYLFQAVEGDFVINSMWVSLNETGIHLRQDDEKIFLAAQDLKTGSPAYDISASFYRLEKSPQILATHSLSGIQEYPFNYPERLDLVVARRGEDVMIIPVSIPNTQAEIRLNRRLDNLYQVFLYTDRPIYRKGAKVAFRGIIRSDNDAQYRLPDLRRVRVYLNTGNEGRLDGEFNVSEGGIFSGEFSLPAHMNAGTYEMVATTELDKSKNYYSPEASYDYTYVDVFEYTKPKYGLEAAVEQSDYVRSQDVKAKITGAFFDGNPLAKEKVEISIYSKDYYETEKAVYNSSFRLNSWGGMCGGGGFFEDYYGETVASPKEYELNENGEVIIKFSSGELKSLLSQEITFVAQKTDENGNKIIAAKSAIVHQGEFNIFFRPGPNRVPYNEEFTQNFYAEDASGQKLADKEFTYEIFEQNWQDRRDPNANDKKVIRSGTVKTNSDGVGAVKATLDEEDKEKYYNFAVTARDTFGNKVEARKTLGFYKETAMTQYSSWYSESLEQTVLKITSDKGSFKVGEVANLEIVSPDDMSVFLAYERGRSYTPQWLRLKKGVNNFKFDVLPSYAPSTTPTFSFFYKGKYYIEGLSLNVPAMHKLIDVEVSTDKSNYNRGDTAIITIRTKDNLGNLIQADVGVGIVDKAIFALKKNAAPPLHSSFYFFRSRSLNTSSSLTWIASYDPRNGRGGGGGGLEALLKDSDTLYWNPSLKTGSDGEVKVEVPVGETETTWRILTYASTNDTKLGQATQDFLVSGN